MPLTAKGEEIKSALQKEYGEAKGEQVLYAGKNKGTFTGIDSVVSDTVDLTNYSTAQLKKSLAEEWSKLTTKEKRDITAEIEKRESGKKKKPDSATMTRLADAVDGLARRFDAMCARGDAEKEKPKQPPEDKEGRSKPPEKWTPETARKRVGGTWGT
jgi:hypothetical protein